MVEKRLSFYSYVNFTAMLQLGAAGWSQNSMGSERGPPRSPSERWCDNEHLLALLGAWAEITEFLALIARD